MSSGGLEMAADTESASVASTSGAGSSSSTGNGGDDDNDVNKFRYVVLNGHYQNTGSSVSSFSSSSSSFSSSMSSSSKASVFPADHPTDVHSPSSASASMTGQNAAVASQFRNFHAGFFTHNSIRTTKYTLVTFLPKSLFEQFRRLANLYFLSAAALSLTDMSPISPVLTVTPLAFVLAVSIVKEGIEDNRRRHQDNDINNKMTLVLRNGCFERVRWSAVRVGDIVKVLKNEEFPADLVFLASDKNDGTCYVETANLDGETNLKLRSCVRSSSSRTGEAAGMRDSENGTNNGVGDPSFTEDSVLSCDFVARIQCEKPNTSLYTFIGNLYSQFDKFYLTPTEVLLRGCRLRNTESVIGGVIFTGMETKMMMNSADARSKRSKLERNMDKLIFFMFSVLMVSAMLCAFFCALWTDEFSHLMWYLDPQNLDYQFNADNIMYVGLANFVTNYILYGYYIPISLYITIELIKIATLLLINCDTKLVDPCTGLASVARTSNLHEELGQVHTILTDKTGTLTANRMEFFMCSINGISYGGSDGPMKRPASGIGKSIGIGSSLCTATRVVDVTAPNTPGPSQHNRGRSCFNLHDDRLCGENWVNEENPETIAMFFRCLAVCHTAMPTLSDAGTRGNDDTDIDNAMKEKSANVGTTATATTVNIEYECESPDENALVSAAKEMGIVCHTRTTGGVTLTELQTDGTRVEEEYAILHVLGFSSDRKRMSVICRNTRTNKIMLFCKGADSVIMKRLRTGVKDRSTRSYQDSEQTRSPDIEAETTKHLSKFAQLGLRTLCIAYREVEDDEFLEWQKMYKKAKMSLNKRKELVEATASMMEDKLTLLGASAIEDRLQDGVPEAIHSLSSAGINIWMLTGDKLETAINIGHSCRLLSARQEIFTVQVEHEENVTTGSQSAYRASRQRVYEQLIAVKTAVMRDKKKSSKTTPSPEYGLVIEGVALGIAMSGAYIDSVETPGTKVKLDTVFEEVSTFCKTVICCRVSPLQKALVTRMVQSDGNKVTLAVGDGANDVGMIQAADIGVGINGLEGMQAVLASDVSIPQFRFLSRLLLVHGRWCYKRLATTINIFFYKNVVLGITLFIQCLFCFSTGQTMFNTVYLSMYSVIFTSLQPLIYGLLEQDVPDYVALRFPGLYRYGQQGKAFNLHVTGYWLLNGLYQGIAIAMITLMSEHFGVDNIDGKPHGMYTVGLSMFNSIVWCVTLQWVLMIEYWTIVHHIAIWGSVFLWYLFLIIFGEFFPPDWSTNLCQLYFYVGRGAMMNFVSPLAVAVAILPVIFVKQLRRRFYPEDVEIIQEMKLHTAMGRNMHDPDTNGGVYRMQSSLSRGDDSITRECDTAITTASPRGDLSNLRCCYDTSSVVASSPRDGKASASKVMPLPMMALSPMFEKAGDGPITSFRN